MNDPIVEQVRQWRMDHTRKFGSDLSQIFDDLRRIQQISDCNVVRRQPKLIAPKDGKAVEQRTGTRR